MPKHANPEKFIADHTVEDGKTRLLMTPDGKHEKYRITATTGGYFVERSVMAGVLYTAELWGITEDGIAVAVPDDVWEQREEFAKDQAAAFAALEKHGIDPRAPLQDSTGHSEREVRRAVADLKSLAYLLVWPPDAVSEMVDQYKEQWGASAKAEKAKAGA